MSHGVVRCGRAGSRAWAAAGAGAVLASAIAIAVPATASESDPLHANVTPTTLSGLLPKDAPGTNAGLSPRLAALANGLADEPNAVQAAELSLRARGAGSLQRDGERLIVSARADSVDAQLVDALRDAGAEIVSVNANYGTVDLSAAPGDLIAIARVPGIESVSEALAPMVGRVGSAGRSTPMRLNSAAAETNAINTCQGSRTSEADTQMQAAAARQTFGVDGTGQKVGILSDSFDTSQTAGTRAANDVASGDLPGPGNPCGRGAPVQVLHEGSAANIDEGRAMAQLVHDLAPGAELAFSSSGATADDMANNIRELRSIGSTVIVDDITYFDEPFFQEGSISTAVNEVAAANIPYYSSAANSNIVVAGQNVGSFESPAFRPLPDCLGLGGACEDFNATATADNSYGLILDAGSRLQINLQWAEPRNGVTTDLDVYAFDATLGTVLVGSSTDNNLQTQKPFELMNVDNSDSVAHTYLLVVYRDAGTASGTPRFKFNLGRPRLTDIEYRTPTGSDIIGPTIFGHNGAANGVSTAAVPFDNAAAPETFSSRGPLAYYFGPVTGATPAAPLATPQVLNKPDLAATDNTLTTFFLPTQTGEARFSGTSAAAPHAAAIAALQKNANPALTTGQVVGAQTATAVPVGSFGHNDVGAGLINAVGAVGANPPLVPETTITKEPRNKIFGKRATYKFTSNLPTATFICKIDRSKYQACTSPVRVVRIPYGKHKFKVAAVNGNTVDPTPAKDKFKRKRRSGREL